MDREQARLLTYDDYLQLPDDELWEIVTGVAYLVGAPGLRHQVTLARISLRVGNHVEAQGVGLMLFAPFDVLLSEHDIVQPDMLYVADASVMGEKYLQGAPTWVVEVVSNPRRDRVLKLDAYGRTGVEEYWIVDPKGETIDVFLSDGHGGFGPPARFAPGDRVSPRRPEGLMIEVADVFRRPR